jgi:hypothetical protein
MRGVAEGKAVDGEEGGGVCIETKAEIKAALSNDAKAETKAFLDKATAAASIRALASGEGGKLGLATDVQAIADEDEAALQQRIAESREQDLEVDGTGAKGGAEGGQREKRRKRRRKKKAPKMVLSADEPAATTAASSSSSGGSGGGGGGLLMDYSVKAPHHLAPLKARVESAEGVSASLPHEKLVGLFGLKPGMAPWDKSGAPLELSPSKRSSTPEGESKQ